MAHFITLTTIPVLPAYLFEADLVIPVAPPQLFTAVPTKDGQVYLHWTKDADTSDTYSDLYTEVYRSENLEDWELMDTRQWLNYDYYTDAAVLLNRIYQYRIRFVRKDALGIVTNVSNYTVPLAAKVVNLLGFEPQDTYSNKFFKYLMESLPGTRIYDRTNAAHFSSNTYHLWQTTCKILDGFTVYVNGTQAHIEPADPTALYSKRAVSFLLDKKQSMLTSTEASTGAAGELVHVNAYLIHTFLMGYALQFMKLYETYLEIVADKFVDYSQMYTKGFRPAVAGQKDASLADLFYSFGKLLGLEPLKYGDTDQGIVRYKSMLKNSFTNQDNLGKIKAIGEACKNTLGITTQTLLEYYKQHWFKSDREHKLYVVPSDTDPYHCFVMVSGSDNDLGFTLLDSRYWAVVRYRADPSGIGLTGAGEGWLEVYGSGPDTPNIYLFDVHVSDGVTTGTDVQTLFTPHSSLITATPSGGTGAGVIDLDGVNTPEQLLRIHSRYVGWEDTLLNMYGRSFRLQDTVAALETSEDLCTMSRMLSAKDPSLALGPKDDPAFSYPAGYTDIGNGSTSPYNLGGLNALESNEIVLAHDSTFAGISYYPAPAPSQSYITLYGDKKMLFRLNMTVSRMQWVTRASLKIFVTRSTDAGYLRLYRIKKRNNTDFVCWNYRDKEFLPSGYEWDNATTEFVPAVSGSSWVISDWEEVGAAGDSDAVFLKEFYLAKVESPSWVTLDVTDIVKDIYKYETTRLDMGEDEQNILQAGFMLTAENYPNRSLVIIKGHSDSNFRPKLVWERLSHGFYQVTPDETRYFYIDGTMRYGRLLVMSDVREPISYIKTVHERIRNQDLRFTSDVAVGLTGNPPPDFVAGAVVYGGAAKAVGTISSVKNNTLYISMAVRNFAIGDTLRILPSGVATATAASVSYVGNKYVTLSRTPVSSSVIRVYHTGVPTTPVTPPADYPAYTPWTEGGSGIEPYFVSSAFGVPNQFAARDDTELNRINLNTSEEVTAIGDVIVTYQYQYDFILLGRAVADSDSVQAIEGCARLGVGLFAQRENDYLYGSELMLPMGSTGEFVDLSGDPTATAYSDHNLRVLCDAVSNVRRANGRVDVFKYEVEGKPYRFGQLYHKFFRGA